MTLDPHLLAILSLAGSSLDVLGALYLAYDLLGGEHGPLRILTRGVTYGVMYGVGYGLGLGPAFGIAGGVSHGITLAWELSRAYREKKAGLLQDAVASAVRAAGFGIGVAWLYGVRCGAAFAVLSTLGQFLAYRIGIRPTLDYHPQKRPRITAKQFLAAVNRTAGYTLTAWFSARLAGGPNPAWPFAVRAGVTIGAVTAIWTFCTPIVEWIADTVPEKRLAVFGLALILCGFLLQSLQYWVVVLNAPVR